MAELTAFFVLFEGYWDSVEPFDWPELPDNVKALCVREMDYATCMNLRGTAHLEKKIVEENLPRFDVLYFQYYSLERERFIGHLKVYGCIGTRVITIYEDPYADEYNIGSLISLVLRYSNIGHVVIEGFHNNDDEFFLDDVLDALRQPFQMLTLKYLSSECLQIAIEQLGERVEMINICQPSDLEAVLQDSLLVSMLMNAKLVQVQELDRDISIDTIISYWIDYDKAIGSKLIIECGQFGNRVAAAHDFEEYIHPMFERILTHFGDRIVNQDRNPVQNQAHISTNNPENVIAMRKVVESCLDGRSQYLMFDVIAAESMPETYDVSNLIRAPHIPPPTIVPRSESSTSISTDSSQLSTVEENDQPPFHWYGLPVEIRTICVTKMDFASIMKLRRTSRLEKVLVEANAPKFDILRIWDEFGVFVKTGDKSEQLLKITKNTSAVKVEALVLSLLKYSRVQGLMLEDLGETINDKTIEKMSEVGCRFEIMSIFQTNISRSRYFHQALLKLAKGVEHFVFHEPIYGSIERALRNAVIVGKLLQAKCVQIHVLDYIPLNTFIDLWIQNNKQVGSKLIAALNYMSSDPDIQSDDSFFSEFLDRFSDRVVFSEEKTVRIRMDDPERNILMRAMSDVYEGDGWEDIMESVVWEVIPASLEPRDYDKTLGRYRWD